MDQRNYGNAAAAEDKKSITDDKELLCSVCRKYRPRALFLLGQVTVSAFNRRCKLHDKLSFRACEHQTWTHQALHDLLRETPYARTSLCVRSNPSGYYLGPLCEPEPGVLLYDKTKYLCTKISAIYLASEKIVLRNEVANLLRLIDQPICPHMRTRDECVRKAIATAACGPPECGISRFWHTVKGKTTGIAGNEWNRLRNLFSKQTHTRISATEVPTVHARPYGPDDRKFTRFCNKFRSKTVIFAEKGEAKAMEFQCYAQGCYTWVCIERVPDKERLEIMIARKLGRLTHPGDPKWVAQIQ